MTVNYQLDVSSGHPLTFLRLLSRWRGSIWKSVAWELSVWLTMFYTIYLSYRFLLTAEYKQIFDEISIHLDDRMKYIPLTFMLGFFVTTVFERWRSALNVMPFIESCALSVAALIPGRTEDDRLYRRSIIRYVVLHQILVFRDISMRCRRRFPTLQYVIDAGFMNHDELDIIENVVHCSPGQKYWVPINWANSLALEAFQKGLIEQLTSFNNLILAIKEFRVAMEVLIKFDQIPIPIAYPQVVFLAVRVYFLLCLVSRQFLESSERKSKTQMTWPVPIMTCLEIIFVLGWMKVAEVLLNPLGEDDDDFEVNWIIDKNIATGMAIVDDTHTFHPPLAADKFSDPDYLPAYSAQSQVPRTLIGSAAKVELTSPDDEVLLVHLEPDETPQTDDRKSLFESSLRKRAFSLAGRRVSDSFSNSEASPKCEPKFAMSLPATNFRQMRHKPDRPTMETLNEENESSRRVPSTESDTGQTKI